MIIRTLKRQEVQKTPYLIWNAFVDLLVTEAYDDLSSKQRPAHLVFRYEGEVQNGGHLQYFENRGTKHLATTIEALQTLGAECHKQILCEAGELWLSRERPKIGTVEEYCETALGNEFGRFDKQFYDCSPSLNECLERHLREHESNFVSVVD